MSLENTDNPVNEYHQEESILYKNRFTSETRPVFKKQIILHSLQAQRVLKRTYGRLMTDLHTIGTICRIHATNEHADKLDVSVHALFDQLKLDIEKALSQADQQRSENGILDLPEYTRVIRYTVDITSPHCHKYLNIIGKQDQLNRVLDALMLTDVMPERERDQQVYHWQRTVFQASNEIRKLANFVNGLIGKNKDNPLVPADEMNIKAILAMEKSTKKKKQKSPAKQSSAKPEVKKVATA